MSTHTTCHEIMKIDGFSVWFSEGFDSSVWLEKHNISETLEQAKTTFTEFGIPISEDTINKIKNFRLTRVKKTV